MGPEGNCWTVRRKWVQRRLRWRGKGGRSIDLMDGSDLASLGADLPVAGVIFTALALLLFAIAAVIFVVPAVVFVAELLLIVALVGLGLLTDPRGSEGHSCLRRVRIGWVESPIPQR